MGHGSEQEQSEVRFAVADGGAGRFESLPQALEGWRGAAGFNGECRRGDEGV